MKSIIVKISGKIIENKEKLQHVLNQLKKILNEHETINSILLIPGGGSFANFIRKICHKIDLDDTIAHWEAIYAMEINAGKMLKEFPNLKPISRLDDFKEIIRHNEKEKYPYVFLPFDYLYEKDELPHTWSVTSDSIAAYISHKLEFSRTFLIKNVDGIIIKVGTVIREIKSSNLKKLIESNALEKKSFINNQIKLSQPIDSHILKLIETFKITVIIINGSLNKRAILDYFLNPEPKEKIYTEIYP
jgi:hypothetical protein